MRPTCPAQTLRLDRTRRRIWSAAELVPSESLERKFEQSSPSASRTASTRQVAVPGHPLLKIATGESRFAMQVGRILTCFGWEYYYPRPGRGEGRVRGRVEAGRETMSCREAAE